MMMMMMMVRTIAMIDQFSSQTRVIIKSLSCLRA